MSVVPSSCSFGVIFCNGIYWNVFSIGCEHLSRHSHVCIFTLLSTFRNDVHEGLPPLSAKWIMLRKAQTNGNFDCRRKIAYGHLLKEDEDQELNGVEFEKTESDAPLHHVIPVREIHSSRW
ncbi:hypothetical protein Q1695_012395 [Nippostrongylus brasiliensis]|nr:hypothetical protein Q1695_012395 [Nippostrongylus brasiliensis]